jgi:hypothetical protein
MGLKPRRTTWSTAATRSAWTHAMRAPAEGCTMNYKLNCLAWRKPYIEVLLVIGFKRLLTIWQPQK